MQSSLTRVKQEVVWQLILSRLVPPWGYDQTQHHSQKEHSPFLQGFLTAVKQEVNRRHAADKWALDDVVMTAEVLHPAKEVDQIREAPQEGVYIYGLFLDGCAWSNKDGKLVDSEPKKLYHPLPVMFVTGVQVCISSAGRPVFEARSKSLLHLFVCGICS